MKWTTGVVSRVTVALGPAVLLGGVVAVSPAAAVADGEQIDRIYGADRVATSIAASQDQFGNGSADAVVLARADAFPDGLAGAALAADKNGPLMLTPPTALDGRVLDEIMRVLPAGKTVYLLGGTGALSTTVDNAVKATPGTSYTVKRLAGADRTATSIAIANEVSSPAKVLLATGFDFPDALGAGAAAGAKNGVVLLTAGTKLPASITTWLSGKSLEVWAVGGPAATAAGPLVDPSRRIVGADRFDTATKLATKFFTSPTSVALATGIDYPDGLSGGGYAANQGAPLLLVGTTTLPTVTQQYLKADADSISGGTAFGGPLVINESVVKAAELAISGVPSPVSTTRISVATGGGPADGQSFEPAISADGRYVGWYAAATNLVPGDTNGALDVFVRDTTSASTTRVSVTSDGVQAPLGSAGPALSEDGRYVAFDSWAALTGGDANGRLDVYLADRATGRVVRVSAPNPALPWSGPGRDSYGPAISADGRYVAFTSAAPNLVPGDTNATADVFVWDRTTRQTTLITRTPGGEQANSGSSDPVISGDGRYIAYASDASNLVPGDTAFSPDVFLWDRTTGTTTRVSTSRDGATPDSGSYQPAISGDGRYVAFQSYATDLVRSDPNGLPDVFVWDRTRASTTLVSTAPGGAPAEGASAHPAISADGRFTVYATEAANLTTGDTNGDTDVVLWDLVTGRTVRVTDTPAAPQDGDSDYPAVSADGEWIAYTTADPDLIPGVSGTQDVYLTRMG